MIQRRNKVDLFIPFLLFVFLEFSLELESFIFFVFVCFILNRVQGLRPFVAHTYPKFTGVTGVSLWVHGIFVSIQY